MGWSSQVVVANQVIIEGSNDGLFVYNGAPATGNLIVSIAAASGVDTYGNTFVAGIGVTQGTITGAKIQTAASGSRFVLDNSGNFTMYDTSGNIQAQWTSLSNSLRSYSAPPSLTKYMDLSVGQLFANPDSSFYVSGSLTAAETGGGGGQGQLALISPQKAVGGIPAQLTLLSNSRDGTLPSVILLQATNVQTSAPVVYAPGGVATTWHTPAYGAGWADKDAGLTVQGVQYRIDNEDNVRIAGAMHSTSATPAGIAFTLPAGFRPTATERRPAVGDQGGGFPAQYVDVNSAGNVRILPNPTTTSWNIYMDVKIRLGNIA